MDPVKEDGISWWWGLQDFGNIFIISGEKDYGRKGKLKLVAKGNGRMSRRSSIPLGLIEAGKKSILKAFAEIDGIIDRLMVSDDWD